jgi:Polyketide cyclase / dehydrase and lipid transport
VRRSAPVFVALRWGAVLALAASAALAHRVVACPLSRDECAGVVSELSQLRGDQLARLRQGERVLEVRDVEQDGARRIQVEGALVVAAPPALAWSVVTDFRSWPAFIPHLARVELRPLGPGSSPVLLHQDTRVLADRARRSGRSRGVCGGDRAAARRPRRAHGSNVTSQRERATDMPCRSPRESSTCTSVLSWTRSNRTLAGRSLDPV